ncbi:MAG TPA: cytochrome C, partial [Thermoanaerobaculia bacterium]|nr:cytochrome C [Thermoanaerobaculia bacterium]
MKKVLKAAGYVVLALVALIAGLAGWLTIKKPSQRAALDVKCAATPERLARGKYLVENVSDCLGCHSDHVDRFSYPVKPGTEGAGGFAWNEKMGFPGYLAAKNITSD